MSRFFNENSDSDSDSEEAEVDNALQADEGGNRFQFEMSSSDEEEKRVVRSNRDKRYDAIKASIVKTKVFLTEDNWVGMNSGYEELNKLLAKAKSIVAKEGIPKFYVKTVLAIRGKVNARLQAKKDGNEMSKLNTSNTKAFNGLKQKMKKYERNNKATIAAYLKDPLISEEEKSDAGTDFDETDSEADQIDYSKQPEKSGDDDDSSDWDSDGSGVSGDDVEDMPVGGIQYTRAYWMKQPGDIEKDKTRKAQREVRQKERMARQARKKEVKKVEVEKKKEKVYTPEMILKKLKELLSMRGKRGTNRKSMMADLELLSTKATDPAAVLKVKVALVSAYFEMNLNKGAHMNVETWNKCYDVLLQMMQSLNANLNIRLIEDEKVEENFEDDEEDDFGVNAMISGAKAKKKVAEKMKEGEEDENDQFTWVKGNFYSFLYRLSSEFTKSLQEIDNQSSAYVARLRDEPKLTTLCELTALYYRNIGKVNYQNQAILIQLELYYYHYHPKYDAEINKALAFEAESKESKALPQTTEDPNTSPTVKNCSILYSTGDTRQRTRALLAHVTFYANHNWFFKARDLLLMSHVQDGINDADITTRILFNRTMAQLGLCAFRTGHFDQTMACMADLHQSQRIKELLAQGISSSRFHERDVKQEKLEKKRQYPFHMHMNLDLLEATHLIGAMFCEVENIAIGRRKMVSKIFRRHYDMNKNNFFNAPPENTRDLIMGATRELKVGNWQTASEYLLNLRMWNHVRRKTHVQSILIDALKTTALRMYLLTAGSSYVSISMESLVAKFELSESVLRKVTSKMVISNQIQCMWDQPTKTLIMHSSQPSRLQKAALKFADKACVFVEQNERLLDQRHGYYQSKGKNDNKRWDRNKNRKNKSNYHNKNKNKNKNSQYRR